MELLQPQPEDIVDLDIRYRYLTSSCAAYTKRYVLRDGTSELGFLSLDEWPLDAGRHLAIYEIFVPRNLRRKGYGTALLKAGEQRARQLGHQYTLVIPKSLDGEFSQAELEDWYRRNGYEASLEQAGAMIRLLG